MARLIPFGEIPNPPIVCLLLRLRKLNLDAVDVLLHELFSGIGLDTPNNARSKQLPKQVEIADFRQQLLLAFRQRLLEFLTDILPYTKIIQEFFRPTDVVIGEAGRSISQRPMQKPKCVSNPALYR